MKGICYLSFWTNKLNCTKISMSLEYRLIEIILFACNVQILLVKHKPLRKDEKWSLTKNVLNLTFTALFILTSPLPKKPTNYNCSLDIYRYFYICIYSTFSQSCSIWYPTFYKTLDFKLYYLSFSYYYNY